ncbi:hypothetical protein [Cystobacter fuscus]|uniref:hypothetical protein n=1 Tax=Cystobacter fuscus TaxID=43 RepID=UPI002B307CE0|nr:hypothetical protein F0U63_29495 [Cystobacter fuscus]
MMKTLKMGLFGLALGVAGALVLPSTEAVAQTDQGNASNTVCCSRCNPNYVGCIGNGSNSAVNAVCGMVRAVCENTCNRTC